MLIYMLLSMVPGEICMVTQLFLPCPKFSPIFLTNLDPLNNCEPLYCSYRKTIYVQLLKKGAMKKVQNYGKILLRSSRFSCI